MGPIGAAHSETSSDAIVAVGLIITATAQDGMELLLAIQDAVVALSEILVLIRPVALGLDRVFDERGPGVAIGACFGVARRGKDILES